MAVPRAHLATAACHNSRPRNGTHRTPHEFRQFRLGDARSRARVAPVHADEGPRVRADDPAARRPGRVARGLHRQALSRRHQLLVGQPVRPREPAHQRRGARAVRAPGTRHLRRLHAPAGGAARRRAGARRAAGPQPLLLRRQRLRRHRSGREDELSLLAQHRPATQDTLHHARRTAITARRWARSRWATWTSTSPSTVRCSWT